MVPLHEKQIQEYLSRLEFDRKITHTKETLDELIYHHQCTIPFETLDMHHCTTPPIIETEQVFDKMITKQRGGYCFELNFLFEALLRGLGFHARPILCRAVRGRSGRMPLNHRGIIVAMNDQMYFVDVGFGGPLAAGALLLSNGKEQAMRNELFITKQIDESWWAIQRKTQAQQDLYGDHGEVRIQVELELCLASVEHIDFEAMNVYLSRRGSLFCETLIANLRTPSGYYGLRDNILTIRENGMVKQEELLDECEFVDAVEQYFGFIP